jgi:hypothetical protein
MQLLKLNAFLTLALSASALSLASRRGECGNVGDLCGLFLPGCCAEFYCALDDGGSFEVCIDLLGLCLRVIFGSLFSVMVVQVILMLMR